MRRILLVDDSLEIRRTMRAMLAELLGDVTFGEAADAASALAALGEAPSEEPWNLVLLDLSLPDRNGIDTLRQIHRMQPALPVLVMSFNVQAEYAAATRAAGAVGYVAKGSSSDAIASAVQSALATPLQK